MQGAAQLATLLHIIVMQKELFTFSLFPLDHHSRQTFCFQSSARSLVVFALSDNAGMWRENSHDDLVLAIALAAWYGEHHRPVVDDSPPSLSFRGSRYSGR